MFDAPPPPPPPAPPAIIASAPERVEDVPIVVTALPTPVGAEGYAVRRVDGDALRSAPGGRIEEALARVAGFAQFRRSDGRSSNPSAQGVTLRGLGGNASSRALVTLDGVPLADTFFGAIPFAALDPATLASVEVTRGGGAGAFGAGALTGVIDARSTPLDRRSGARAFAALSSLGDRRLSAGAVAALGAGRVALDVAHESGEGFFTTPPDERVAASVRAAYAATRLALTAEAPLGDALTLQGRLAGFDDARTLRFRGADSGIQGLDASVRATGGTRWQVDALGWLQARDFRSVVVSATSFRPTLDQYATPSNGWGAKVELRPPVPRAMTLRLGADIRGGEGTALERALAADGSITRRRASGGAQSVAGLFGELGAATGRMSGSIGVRLDRWRQSSGFARESLVDGRPVADARFADRVGIEPSVRAAVRYAMSPAIDLRAAAYTGFRLPTLNELYRGFTVFPVVTRANPALDLERLRGVQIGLDLRPAEAVRLSLTGYRDRLGGAIGNVTIGPNLRERRSLDAIVSTGVEAEGEWRRGPFLASASLAYADARIEAGDDPTARALDGLRPAQTPRLQASARLMWTGGLWRAEAGVRHVGEAFEDDRNVDRLPAATMVDARLGWRLTDWLELALAVENLFDVDVVTRNAGGSIDLGAPRTGWLTLRWRGAGR